MGGLLKPVVMVSFTSMTIQCIALKAWVVLRTFWLRVLSSLIEQLWQGHGRSPRRLVLKLITPPVVTMEIAKRVHDVRGWVPLCA